MKKKSYNKAGFTKIDKVLAGKKIPPEFAKALMRYRAISSCSQVLAELFEQAEGQTKVIDVRGGVLVVGCLSQELAFQIRLYAQRIIAAINQALGKTIIYALKVES